MYFLIPSPLCAPLAFLKSSPIVSFGRNFFVKKKNKNHQSWKQSLLHLPIFLSLFLSLETKNPSLLSSQFAKTQSKLIAFNA